MRRCKKRWGWCAVCACLLIALPLSSVGATDAGMPPADVIQRVAELYANPEVIQSLCAGKIPARWQKELNPFQSGDMYFSYQCRPDRMAWWLWLDEVTGDLDVSMLDLLHRINSDGSLRYFYDPTFQKDALLAYDDCDHAWSRAVPADRSGAMLDEFVALAAASTGIWGELDSSERSERLALYERHFERWREEFQLSRIALNEGMPFPCLEANYQTGMYTVYLYSGAGYLEDRGNGDFEYALTSAQIDEAYAACVNETPPDRLRFLDQYVRSLGLWPSRILMLMGWDEEQDVSYCLEFYDWDETYNLTEDSEAFDSIELTREQFDALAAEWYPLSPQERVAPMEKAFRSLR